MSLTGKTLAATYQSLLKLSTTDQQNFDGTVRNIVDGEDTASNLSLTDPNDNNTARLSNININNENSYQLQGDVNLQNVNKRTPLKIITYIKK